MHSAGLGQRQTRPLLVPRPGQGEDKGREEWLTLTERVRLPRPSPVQAAPHLTLTTPYAVMFFIISSEDKKTEALRSDGSHQPTSVRTRL